MMRSMLRSKTVWIFAVGVLLLIGTGFFFLFCEPKSGGVLDASTLVIRTQNGQEHVFRIEIADNMQEKMTGLMFRQELPQDHGMLFVNEEEQSTSMWMKNTLIPLDMLFIGPDGEIVNIEADAIPGDLTPRGSQGPVKAALEINGGLARKLGIRPGDLVIHPVFLAPSRS